MDESLHNQVISLLNIDNASRDDQTAIVDAVMSVAESRLARLIPYLLSDGQLQEFDIRVAAGSDLVSWLIEQVPYYPRLLHAAVLDVAEEVSFPTS